MNKDAKKILKISLISFLFVFIAIFAFFNSRDLIFGVKIRNMNIADNMKFEGNILKVEGNAKNAVKLTLNDRDISVDQDGNFTETIILFPGYNTVKIYAQDKFGKSDEKIFRLIGGPVAETGQITS